jgi:peroxiredoxin
MTPTTIGAQVEEFRREASGQADPRMEVFAREQAELSRQLIPADVVKVGDALPDVDLLRADGRSISLSEALGDSFTVLVFYRGAWCPYCNIALRTYHDELLPGLRGRGAELIALSPQKPDGSLTMKEKHDLEFEVLSDPGLVLARAAGILTEPTEPARAVQLELGLDLTEINADGTVVLPMPTVAIVDPASTVRWIDVRPDYTARSEPEDILAALDALTG